MERKKIIRKVFTTPDWQEVARDAMENNLRGPEAFPFPKKATPPELEL
ncbi:MAG: hypothetical protein WAK57_03495 [Desulfobacterales bacterium]|jgi:hypothetical protein